MRAGPIGARPLSGGSRKSSVPPRRNQWSFKSMSGPSRSTLNASGVWNKNAESTFKVWRLHPVVDAFQALRGVPCTVAVTMVAEIGDLTRFEPPSALMKCLG
jgi:hypothetical protein